jgi:UDP-N-acetylglucosamine 2-epimerase (non-hydrolysing)
MPRIMVVYGTRPEAIKLATVIGALRAAPMIEVVTVVTGQHRAMLDQVNGLFRIVPDVDLDVIEPRQELPGLTSRVMAGVTAAIREHQPDAVMVQGDTTTSFVAGLAAFYERVPVLHVEAGLRTEDRYNPFPEEMNRRLTSQLASLHFAPTQLSRANLLADGIEDRDVVVTGNTVIDALLDVVARELPMENPDLKVLDGGPAVLVTSHRRESWGAPMANTAAAIATLARRFPDVRFLLPAHLNPIVREVLLPPLRGLTNVTITEPLSYGDFAHAMNRASIMLTDSGGVQEEAPSLGKPVLVLRENTERPEAVDAGTVKLVGTDQERIVAEVSALLTDPAAYATMARAVNPYGDGLASQRVAAAVAAMFGVGTRTPPWDGGAPTPTRSDRASHASAVAAGR